MTSRSRVQRPGAPVAAGHGAAWGAVAGACYALALGVLLALHTGVNGLGQAAPGDVGRAGFVVLAAVLVAAVVAVPVGAVAGFVLGLAALPLARAGSPRGAGWVAAAVVLLAMVAVLLAVWFGGGVGGVDGAAGVGYFCVLPALMAAGGAYQHTSRLSSREAAAEPRSPAQSSPGRGELS